MEYIHEVQESGARDLHLRVINSMSSRVSLGEVTHREHEMLGDLGRDSVAHHY